MIAVPKAADGVQEFSSQARKVTQDIEYAWLKPADWVTRESLHLVMDLFEVCKGAAGYVGSFGKISPQDDKRVV